MVGRVPYLRYAAVILGVILAMERQGRAALEYQVAANSMTGVASNATSQSNDSSTSIDGYQSVSGRFRLNYIGQSVQEQIGYAISAMTYLRGAQGYTLSHSLIASCRFDVGSFINVSLDAGATLTQLSLLDAPASTDPQALGPRPAGNQEFITMQAGEGVVWQPTPSWRVSESVQGRMYRTIHSDAASASNKTLTLDAQLSRMWQHDSIGLRARMGAMWSTSGRQTGQATGMPPYSEIAEFGLRWAHEWTPEWWHEILTGVFVQRANGTRYSPAVTGTVRWQRFGHEIALLGGRSAESNIYVGTTYQRTYVGARVGLPIDNQERLRLIADGNVEHDTTSSNVGGSQASANVFAARVGMTWQLSNFFVAGLDYSYRDQRASSSDSGPSIFASIRRQAVMLTLGAHYPSGL